MQQILSLVPDQTDGFAPARLWLADQALLEKPYIPLNDEQIEVQLLKVLKQYPDHADSHRRLADIYLRKSEWKLAEVHLMQAARTNPELSLAVAKIKQKLQRDPGDVQSFLQQAATEFQTRVSSNRLDVRSRIALAETFLLQGQKLEAREQLISGLKQQDHPDLRRALSELDLSEASQQLKQNALNRDYALQMILNSLQTDASNPAAVQELTRIHSLGVKIPRSGIQPGLDYWQSRADADPENVESRLMLCQLLAIADAPEEAATLLRPLAADQPALRLPLVKLLLRSKQTEEGDRILEQLIAEQREHCLTSPQDPLATAALAELLLIASRPLEAVKLIQQLVEETGLQLSSSPPLLTMFGRTSLLAYDAIMALDYDPAARQSDLTSDQVIGLLRTAVSCPETAMSAIERLAKLSASSHPQAAQAEQLVNQLRTQGDPDGQILLRMGTFALQSQQYDRAISFLEQANNLARQRDPGILNNLAVALVRSEPSQPGRALELINSALLLLPDQPDILSTRGEIYVALKRWQEALVDLERALPFRRDSKVIHSLLSTVHDAMGNQPLAEEHRKAAEQTAAADQ